MTPPTQLQRMPKRPKKPATVRVFFWAVAAVCVVFFFAGLIAKCTPNPVFPL